MNKKIIIFLLILFNYLVAFSQNYSIRGVVVDSISNQKIEYANVSITTKSDSLFISGGITNQEGIFYIKNLENKKYDIEISFIGYQSKIIQNLILKKGDNEIGIIRLSPTTENLNTVTVTANKSSIIYKVDRKVINAESFPEATSGIELLENVPSVQVSIDGKELKYREDGIFKVLINGKPVNNGVEKLREIPAKQIDKIEVITNPSAKYYAEGTAGIINVILKKTRLQGYAINVGYTGDTRGTYQWLFSINKNGKKSGWYINGQYANYIWDYEKENELQEIKNINSTNFNNLETIKKSGGKMNFIEAGFNYDITPKDEIDFSFNINPFSQTNEVNAKTKVNTKIFVNDTTQIETNYNIENSRYLAYRYYGPTLTYKHKFNQSGSKFLSFDIDYSAYLNKLTDRIIDSKIYTDTTIKQGAFNTEQNEKDVKLNINYENPIGDDYNIETGISIETNHIPQSTFENGYFKDNNITTQFDYSYINQEIFFIRDIYATYLSFKGKMKKLDYKIGLRSEYTVRTSDYSFVDTNYNKTKVPYNKDFLNFFPSFHTTYSFTEDHQIALSYSKRISRPQYYELMPVRQYETPFSYTIGNAKLNPTYINAIELNYKKSWNNNFFSTEIFSRFTDNVMQYYTRVDANGLMYLTNENVGKSQSIGSEIMGTYNFTSWWVSNLSLNLYSYKLFVYMDNKSYNKSQFNSDTKFNNTFKLPKSIKIKINFTYYSPSITAQSTTKSYYLTKIAISKSFFKDHWNLLLYTNNIFGDIKEETFYNGDAYNVNQENKILQFFGFSVSYDFNNQE